MATMTPEATYEGQDLEALADMNNYVGWIIERFRPYLSGRAVEIGAGMGSISRRLLPLVDGLEAVEPADNLQPALRAALAGGNATIRHRTLEAWLAEAPPRSFDCVVMVNVLEHVADDRAALRGLREVLRPGGYLLLFVPALPALYSPLDRLLGHHRRYLRHDLAQAVEQAGLTLVSNQYMDVLGSLAWWLINRKLGARAFNPAMVRLYDRFGVPTTRALEAVLPAPFGKNLLTVARGDAAE
jgi:SAM-dependent methyltransferase